MHTHSSGAPQAVVPADVPVTKQKLAAEVALLDDVVVRHRQHPPLATRHPHERKVFQKLAAKRARPDQKHVQRLQLGLQRAPEDRHLPVVARAQGRHLLRGQRVVGQRLDRVKVEKLKQRVKLAAGRLDHLLADHAAKHGRHGVELPGGAVCQLAQHVPVEVSLGCLVDLVGQGQQRLGVLLRAGRRKAVVLGLCVAVCAFEKRAWLVVWSYSTDDKHRVRITCNPPETRRAPGSRRAARRDAPSC